jgi:hypothetical protein
MILLIAVLIKTGFVIDELSPIKLLPDSPNLLKPHAQTVPSFLNATEFFIPPLIAFVASPSAPKTRVVVSAKNPAMNEMMQKQERVPLAKRFAREIIGVMSPLNTA